MAENYENLGPAPPGDLPPPPPPPAANLDPTSHVPARTKFENASADGKTNLWSTRSAQQPSKKGNKKKGEGSKASPAARGTGKKGSKQSTLKTDENVQDDDEEDEDPAERIKKMGYGKRANISLAIISITMAISGILVIVGMIGCFSGWTL